MSLNQTKILVKFPTRNRPEKFVKTLNSYIDRQTTNDVHYLVTVDDDDYSMNEVLKVLKDIPFVSIVRGVSTSKIHACNRGIDTYVGKWDILCLASDDMVCISEGWDARIIKEMIANFPDMNGVLHFNDGTTGETLNTFCILGHTYYNRFGYIYHPDYKSLWSDNEFMVVSQRLNKVVYFKDVLFEHQHPAWGKTSSDALYNYNDKFYHKDKATYETRRAKNFGI